MTENDHEFGVRVVNDWENYAIFTLQYNPTTREETIATCGFGI
jgi:hypothetical protein